MLILRRVHCPPDFQIRSDPTTNTNTDRDNVIRTFDSEPK